MIKRRAGEGTNVCGITNWHRVAGIPHLSPFGWPGDESQARGSLSSSWRSVRLSRRCLERLMRYKLRLWRNNSRNLVMQGKAVNATLGKNSMKKQSVESRYTTTAVCAICVKHELWDAAGFTLPFTNTLGQ